MKQNSRPWLEWRHNGIGGSDAPIIMGDSPNKTRFQLFNEKIGPLKEEKGDNFILKKGHCLEKKARPIIELIYGLDLKPYLFQSKYKDFMRCSLDGFNHEKNIAWEGKFVGQEDFDFVKDKKEPLKKHFAQLQHQLMLSEAEKVIYTVYTAEKFDIKNIFSIDVYPDKDYMEKLAIEECKFWGMVQAKEFLPDENDEIEIKSEKTITKIREYLELKVAHDKINTELKKIKTELDDKKEEIFSLCDSPNMFYENIEIKQSSRVGGIDYKKTFEMNKENIKDVFYKEASLVKTIKVTKGNE